MSRILLVDDDVQQLDLLRHVLETAGYRVDFALSPTQTERRIANSDLVLMDLRFANASGESDAREGIALIRRIRDLGYSAPVIVLSGWPADLEGLPERQLVSLILPKPVAPRDLLYNIREVLAAPFTAPP
jgi:CheY-like chemotaxis protein